MTSLYGGELTIGPAESMEELMQQDIAPSSHVFQRNSTALGLCRPTPDHRVGELRTSNWTEQNQFGLKHCHCDQVSAVAAEFEHVGRAHAHSCSIVVNDCS